ncbi:hypothetical protein RIF29_27230 [Crotalaria pallida]|uniref:DUF868 family protein n=1 Tax=Crotalaria pallida TaxID=3830 RepID=A0AAN9EPN5_CROPI
MNFISSSFPSCFHQSKTTDDHHPPPSSPPPPPLSSNPNLTTYIYHTNAGFVSLTWSRSILGRSLHVHLHHSSISFNLLIKPFIFLKKRGTKKISNNARIFWNLSRASFGSGPEPRSGFYVALVVDNALTLLQQQEQQKVYNTRARFGGKVREIEISCETENNNDSDNNSRLLFCVEGERVLIVESLKWKFRGSERVEVDGVNVLISWDVHDWVFNQNSNNNNRDGGGHDDAVFMLKFEENEVCFEEERGSLVNDAWRKSIMGSCEFGSSVKTAGGKSSSSSSSVSVSVSSSSAAGSCGRSSSMMEWSSVEENELVGHVVGFTLPIHASKR